MAERSRATTVATSAEDLSASRPSTALEARRRTRSRLMDNLASTSVLLRRRKARRRMERIVWKGPLAVAAVVVLLTLVTIDTYFAANRLTAQSLLFKQALAWTHWGKSGTILFPTAIVLIASSLVAWRRLRPRSQLLLLNQTAMSAYLFLSVALAGLVVNLIKPMVGRARPSLYLELGAFHLDPWTFHARFASFPSGHSSAAGATAMGIALLFPPLRIPALIVALWLASTRVFVGSHYISDAVAGLMIGAWFAYAGAVVFSAYGLLFETSPGGLPRPRATFHVLPRSMQAQWAGLFPRPARLPEGLRLSR